MENKKEEEKRRIGLQILYGSVSLIAIFLIFGTNILLYPKPDIHIKDNNVTFEWFGLINAMVDDNPKFTSPIIIEKDNPKIELKSGIYYWKAGLSMANRFFVDSEVSVSVKPTLLNNENAYRIENQGNVKIMLKIIGTITGNIILEPEAITYQKNVSGIEKIEASEK